MELAVRPALWLKRLRWQRWLPRSVRALLALLPDEDSSPAEETAKFLAATTPSHPDQPRRGRLGFVSGCVMRVLFGGTNAASVRLLNRGRL
jgi:hypothetical protein